MKKKIHQRKRKASKSLSPPLHSTYANSLQNVKPKTNRSLWKALGYVGLIVTILVGIVALILYFNPIKDLFKDPKEKFEEQKFVTGDLKFPKIPTQAYTVIDTPPNFHIDPLHNHGPKITGISIKSLRRNKFLITSIGNYVMTFFPSDLERGINVFYPLFNGCITSKLILAVKGDRLYVSAEFRDLFKEETIGIIEFNHWRLYKDNMINFENDDERLEVRDKQNNIVFSICYTDSPPGLFVSGYFIDPTSILIIQNMNRNYNYHVDTCIPKSNPNWKQDALIPISAIPSNY